MQHRGTWVSFSGEYKHYTIELCCLGGGGLRFTCGALVEPNKDGNRTYDSTKTFTNLETLLTALDKYDLKLRKNFENNLAFYIGYESGGGVRVCEVTSISEDGQEAWVKFPAKQPGGPTHRQKVVVKGHLFSDRKACEAHLRLRANLAQTFTDAKQDAEEQLAKAFQWTPLFATEKEQFDGSSCL